MKDFVIYSVMVGGYDEIRQPLVVDDRFDYVLFSDQHIGETIGVWQVHSIPYEDDNLLRLSRYPKVHPTKVLGEYKASLYIDANLQIVTPVVYDRCLTLYDEKVEWGAVKHPTNDCVYREMYGITNIHWVHDYEVVNWYGYLEKNDFPRHYGLYENNCIFRIHSKRIEQVGNMWWATLRNDCKRDQYSLMYCLFTLNPSQAYLLDEKECPRTNSVNFNYFPHITNRRSVELSFHETVRERCLRIKAPGEVGYQQMLDEVGYYHNPKMGLYWWEFKNVLHYGVQVIQSIIKRKIHR